MEYVRKRYNREEEGHKPWYFATIANRPDFRINGFYPLSEFAVHKSMRISPKSLNSFPNYLMVSSNYYRRGWSMKFHRRLKNVIMTMDWIPSTELLEMTGI
jgi:hypothetical protein